MRNYLKVFGCSVLLSGLVYACEVINPEEGIPAYVYVADFSLGTGLGQGSNSHNITDVWLSVEGEFLGMYTLPATIPVLREGETSLTLDPGIRDNGINATPDIYPFYESYQITVDLKPGSIDTIRPATRYRGNTRFSFVEEFETENQIFREIRIGNLDHRVFLSEDVVFEGDRSARVPLDGDTPVVEIATVDRYRDLTASGAFVYIEVNYKSDVPCLFGVIAHDGGPGEQFLEAGFLPSADWNKIYLNMTPLFFMGGPSFDEYQIVFQTVIPLDGIEPSMPTGTMYIDNVKLVHF